MNKIVNLGHWIVGLLFAAVGLVCLFYTYVQGMPSLLLMAHGYHAIFFISYPAIILWVPLLLSAWGIGRWKKWGHALGLVQVILLLCWCVRWLVYVGMQNVGMRGVIRIELLRAFLIGVCVLGWFVLPAVRHRYWREVAAA